MKLHFFIYVCVFSLSYGFSQSIYHKDVLTILADSLHKEGEYEKALVLRNQAIKTQINTPKYYQNYLKAKYFHTNLQMDWEVFLK